jgi:transcriptional regulator with XRE-family HTH domain
VWDLKSEHSRAARHLLVWTIADLARAAGVSGPALQRFERGETNLRVTTLRKLMSVFELKGISFENPANTDVPHVHCHDGTRVTLDPAVEESVKHRTD